MSSVLLMICEHKRITIKSDQWPIQSSILFSIVARKICSENSQTRYEGNCLFHCLSLPNCCPETFRCHGWQLLVVLSSKNLLNPILSPSKPVTIMTSYMEIMAEQMVCVQVCVEGCRWYVDGVCKTTSKCQMLFRCSKRNLKCSVPEPRL